MLAVRSGPAQGADAMPGNPTPLAAGSEEPPFTPTQLEMSEEIQIYYRPIPPIGVRGE